MNVETGSSTRLKDAVDLMAVKRALVIKLRNLGDVLLSSPVFSVLKNHAPHIEIDALVYSDTEPMVSLHPAISRVLTIDRRWKEMGIANRLQAEWRLIQSLRARKYELVILLNPHRRGQWLTYLLKPRWAVAPKFPRGGRLWERSFTHLVSRPMSTWRHTVEMNLDFLRRIGCFPSPDERQLTLVAGSDAEASADMILDRSELKPNSFVHLHPASRWMFKCWPAARNGMLIDRLYENGWPVVVTSAPGTEEREFVRAVLKSSRQGAIDLSGQLSLKEMVALTKRARLFVGVDSAPMHIAAAVGTPTVALFGPSGAPEWGPWQVSHRLLTNSAFPCVPCGRDGCGGSKVSECLEEIPVEQVLGAALDLLNTP